MLLGASGFWLPDVVFHAAANANAADVRVITVVLPITLLSTCILANRIGKFGDWKSVGAVMTLGVWAFGGVFMMISATFGGGGFASNHWHDFVTSLLLALVPGVTCMMSAYDGSMGALLLVTIAVVIWFVSLLWSHPRAGLAKSG